MAVRYLWAVFAHMFEDESLLRAALHGARGGPFTQLPLPLVLCACKEGGDGGVRKSQWGGAVVAGE